MQINANNKGAFTNEILDKAISYYGTLIERVEIFYNIKTVLDNDNILLKKDTRYYSIYHYKLSFTNNSLNYGYLVKTHDNIYVNQLDSNNLLLITVIGDTDFVELYKKGNKIMEWIDIRITDNKIIRYLGGNEYIFENN